MNLRRKVLLACVLALAPTMAMSARIIALPTDTTGGAGEPFRHNLFHDASIGSGANGTVLAWFDLDNTMVSTWNPTTGALDLHVSIFSDSSLTNLIGTGHATSSNLFGAGFNDFDDTSLGLINWSFTGSAATVLANSIVMDFIDHPYQPDTDGNLPNTYVGNTLTLWGADGMHNGNGFFDGSTLGVDMVIVVSEPTILILMGLGLLGFGALARKR